MGSIFAVSAVTADAHGFFAVLVEGLGFAHQPLELLQLFVLALARWAPIFALVPFLGGRLVPAPIKLGLSVGAAAWLLPGLSEKAPVPLVLPEIEWWTLVLKELLIGLTIGFMMSLIFWAADMAGRFIDQARARRRPICCCLRSRSRARSWAPSTSSSSSCSSSRSVGICGLSVRCSTRTGSSRCSSSALPR